MTTGRDIGWGSIANIRGTVHCSEKSHTNFYGNFNCSHECKRLHMVKNIRLECVNRYRRYSDLASAGVWRINYFAFLHTHGDLVIRDDRKTVSSSDLWSCDILKAILCGLMRKSRRSVQAIGLVREKKSSEQQNFQSAKFYGSADRYYTSAASKIFQRTASQLSVPILWIRIAELRTKAE